MINDILFIIVIIMFLIFKKTFKIKKINSTKLLKKNLDVKSFLLGEKKSSIKNKIDFNKKETKEVKLNLDFNLSNEVELNLEKINFNQETFLSQTNYIIEAIYESIYTLNIDKIKKNISPFIYKKIYDNIEMFKQKNKFFKSNLISVLTKKINNIYLKNKTIFIDTLIETEQINYIENSKQELLEGNKKTINKIKELWSFSKNIYDSNSYWIVDNIIEVSN